MFKKLLALDVDSRIESEYWKRIDTLTEKRISLSKDDPQIKENLKDTECLLVSFLIDVTKEVIDAAPNLKYIGVLATGFGRIDIDYAKSKGIVVCNIPGYSTESVAEFVIAALLEALRHLEEGKQRVRNENYSEAGISATEIKDKVFGVVGLGNIGRRVAELAQGFGANVEYWSKNKKDIQDAKYQELDELISQADFVSINVAYMSGTEKLLSAKRFQALKPGVVVVNTAPMDVVDIDGLVERLKKDDITFIFDHSDETSEEDLKRLKAFKNCIIYPPIAYVSKEATKNKQEVFIRNIENFLKGNPINSV